MDRLTIRNSDGSVSQPTDLKWVEALDKLAAYEDSGLSPEEIREMMTDWLVWKQTEAEGRLVVLPCKVGDTVYQTDGIIIYEHKIKKIIFRTDPFDFDENAIGHSVFLTREEAEKALEAHP